MANEVVAAEPGASLKWPFVHIGQGVRAFIGRHWFLTTVTALIFILLFLMFREVWQPAVIWMRRFAPPALLSVGIIYLFWRMSRGLRWFKRSCVMVLSFVLVSGFVAGYEYLSLWVRYNSFHVEVLKERHPETGYERILPLMSVHALARGVMGDSRLPAQPDFVWRKNKKTGEIEYRWTMAVEPGEGKKFWLDKVFGSIEEVINVSGTNASLDFSSEGSRVPVQFAVGEGLWLSSNSHTAAVRRMSTWQFLNYEATDDVRYLENDEGEIVEVISLIRWQGVLFPYPEFGGVFVVHQVRPRSITELAGSFLKRVAFGAGEWVSPERIQEFPYLRGQNILPYRVSQYVAESLRFMEGPLAPLPGFHQGDVRVPEPVGNLNRQPYATFFKSAKGLPGMLYHYFSLEPFLGGNSGLVVGVLIPADGTQRVFVYKHEERRESLMGVSMVPGIVRNSKMNYNWEKSAPIEERPYVRYVNEQLKFLWLTTVVTCSEKNVAAVPAVAPAIINKDATQTQSKIAEVKKCDYVTGDAPEVALVDAGGSHRVYWVDPRDQASWIKAISQ